MSKNAEGWIRHRGGKCPVALRSVIDVRYRNGKVIEKHFATENPTGEASTNAIWQHRSNSHDIMAYRLHKPAEQVEACSKPDPRDSAKRDSDYVCWMRDRITTIGFDIHALTTERAELVQKLASDGFALIGRINDLLTDAAQKHEDMSDWRNWKVGDCARLIDKVCEETGMEPGSVGEITRIDEYDRGGHHVKIDDHYWPLTKNLSWHSRPSA